MHRGREVLKRADGGFDVVTTQSYTTDEDILNLYTFMIAEAKRYRELLAEIETALPDVAVKHASVTKRRSHG